MTNAEIANEVAIQIFPGKDKVSHPKVLVLMGLQYAGKSYLAEQITEKNFTHFWATKVKKDYGIENPDMVEVATLVLERVVSEGYNIVIDFVNHKYDIRQQFQAASEKLGADYSVVYLDTPKEERLRRREQNVEQGDQPGRRVISLEQMDQFEAGFEPPRDEEPTIRLQTQAEIDHFITSLD